MPGGLSLLTGLLKLPLLILWALLAAWVYVDASRRYPPGSLAPIIWGLATLLGGILVVLLYLLVRPPKR